MTKEQALEKLIDQINCNMNIFLTIISVVFAVFLYLQWSISDHKIKRLKDDINSKLIEDYKINEVKKLIDDVSAINKEIDSIKSQLKDNSNKHDKLEETVKREETSRFMHLIEKLNNQLDALKFPANGTSLNYSEIENNIKLACENTLVDIQMKSICIYHLYLQIDSLPQREKNYKLAWESIIVVEAKNEFEVGKQLNKNVTDSFNKFNNREGK